MTLFLLVYFGCLVAVGIAASRRGRNGIGWFLLACLISPLLAWLLLFFLTQQGCGPLDELLTQRRSPLDEIAALAKLEREMETMPEGSNARRLLARQAAEMLAEYETREKAGRGTRVDEMMRRANEKERHRNNFNY
jgi:hypothetical protein